MNRKNNAVFFAPIESILQFKCSLSASFCFESSLTHRILEIHIEEKSPLTSNNKSKPDQRKRKRKPINQIQKTPLRQLNAFCF
jgi:hypothetical protein